MSKARAQDSGPASNWKRLPGVSDFLGSDL